MSATPSDPASPAPSAPDGPLIVQSDKSVLLEVAHPQAGQARRAIAANEAYLDKVAREGAEKAAESASSTIKEVRRIIGFRTAP